MLPDRVSNPGPLTYESGALPIALRGPARSQNKNLYTYFILPALRKKDCAYDGIFNLYLACI